MRDFSGKYRYFFEKLGLSILTLALTIILLFILLRQIPGDILQIYALKLQGQQGITYDRAYELASELLNYDPNENVLSALAGISAGCSGGSSGKAISSTGVTANSLIRTRLPWTLFVSSVALFLSFFIGKAIGSIAAQKRGRTVDKLASGYIAISGSIPDYLVALLLVILFAYRLKWFPAQNNYNAFEVTPGFNFPFLLNVLYYAFLPILAYTIVQTGNWILHMRGSCISVLGKTIFSPPAQEDSVSVP